MHKQMQQHEWFSLEDIRHMADSCSVLDVTTY